METAIGPAIEPKEEAQPDLEAARRVLDREAEGLQVLSRALDGGFVEAIDRLAAVRGRVIVSGMGKSGHVARKIAATLASTGTPAHFVHPGEASHGDLGMITNMDAVIALSNSGDTVELGDLIVHTRRHAIPLIAITAQARSQLAEQADVALILPQAEEACPMGLAPTTSTTMMLGLGDALAIALLERKGFSASQFHLLHPGGSLGQKLKRVAEVMHGPKELPLCRPDTPMSEAILVMTAKTWGCVGVTDEHGRLLGIITDGDLRRHMKRELLDRTAGEVMTRKPLTIHGAALVAEALGVMNNHKIHCLFVVDETAAGTQPIGIVRIHDCLHAGFT
ncbi:MAG: SIS domain-containing protein [Kiloniellales bacterium]